MRKSITIIAIVVLALLIAAGAVFFFVPGIMEFSNGKKNENRHIPSNGFYADIDIPGRFSKTTANGLTLYLPEYLEKKYPDATEGIKAGTYSDPSKETKTAVIFMEPTDYVAEQGEFFLNDVFSDSENTSDMSVESFKASLEKLDIKVPENYYEYFWLVYAVSPDDYDAPDEETEAVLSIISSWQNIILSSVVEVTPIETDDAAGFITLYSLPEGEGGTYKVVVELYSKDNLNVSYGAMVASEDYETVKQIINSAQLAKENEE